MKKSDPFSSAFDGLPLLSDVQVGGMGLFLLRAAFLLISSVPMVLSMLDAIAGTAANVLYAIGVCALCVPLFVDVVRRTANRLCGLDSLLILLSAVFLAWSRQYVEAAGLLIFYHICDLALCLILRMARKQCDTHTSRIFNRAVRVPKESDDHFYIEAGEILGVDCRVVEGDGVASLCFLDAQNGEFEVSRGDVLFAGTEIVDGTLSVSVIEGASRTSVEAVRRKLKRCLKARSAVFEGISRSSVYVQTAFLLFVLMNVTFFDMPINESLLAFSSVFFCFDFFLRFHRAFELFYLSFALERGIIPEKIQTLFFLHRLFAQLQFVKAPSTRSQFLEGGLRYRLKRRLHRANPLVLERATESSFLISRCDLALLYRTRDVLAVCAQKSLECGVLFWLCTLAVLVSLSISLLLLDLSGSLVLSLLILSFVLLFVCFATGFAWRKKK